MLSWLVTHHDRGFYTWVMYPLIAGGEYPRRVGVVNTVPVFVWSM
ncbi:hypothetical protein HMPREF1861_00387 [Corynebacterium kroppenstedtii]|nr:hypothetical protein HMPREF1861_00387 [Corynebacterium kroppenstedtii]